MRKLSTVEEFSGLRQRIESERKAQQDKTTIVISADTGGQASGVNDIIRLIKRYIVERSLQQRIGLRITGCQGFCEMNPYVLVEPGGHFW